MNQNTQVFYREATWLQDDSHKDTLGVDDVKVQQLRNYLKTMIEVTTKRITISL